MVFANIDELIAMGGHGPYVWAAYLVTLAAIITLCVEPLLAQRRQLREIARRARRDAARQPAAQPTSPETSE
jgi:heme exporter protein D